MPKAQATLNSELLTLNSEKVFRKMCQIRHFELKVAEAYEQKRCPGPVYLAVGQEACAATVAEMTPGYSVFTQHRGHSAYLAHGGDPEKLRDELLGLETGCCQGRGGSPCIQDLSIPMYGHHGLIGENIPLATGYALASKKPTVVYFGDAAGEEDYAMASFGFAATHKLPVLFVCEDNDLSILTPVADRRSWEIVDVVEAMGITTAVVEDDPDQIQEALKQLLAQLPAFIQIKTCRHLWHAGVGTDGPPKWDRLKEMRATVPNATTIEEQVKQDVEALWQEVLQKQ